MADRGSAQVCPDPELLPQQCGEQAEYQCIQCHKERDQQYGSGSGHQRENRKPFREGHGKHRHQHGTVRNLSLIHIYTDNIKESGHSLNQFSGLWIKGEAGENYITIWNDEPVKRMDLEIEMEEEEQERIEPVPAEPEVEFEKPLNGVRAQEAELIAGLEASETDLPETDLEPDEACVPEEIMSDPAAGESPNDREQEVKASGETGQELSLIHI